MSLLGRVWRAASRPRAFHAGRVGRPEIGRALVVAVLSCLIASLVAAVLAARATGSTAYLPFLVGVPLVVLPYLGIVSLLGALLLMRPAGMDLRAWEVVLWGWAPAGLVSVSLLPIGMLAPAQALVAAALLLPPWHLWCVGSGVGAHAPGRARTATVLYAIGTFGVPVLLAGVTLVALATLS